MQKVWKFIRKRWLLISIGLVVVIGIFLWWQNKQKAARPDLTFAPVERGTLVKTLEVTGNITAKEYATLRFAAGGKITHLGAKEGDYLQKGHTIATIDQRTLQKSLQKDLNNYSKERLDWDQQLDDIKDRPIDQEERRSVQKNQYDLNNSVLDVEITDIAITNTVLSAPFNGVLIALPTQVAGVNVLATDVFEMVNPDTVVFKAQVDELDISQVKTNQEATLELDAYPDEIINTTVSYVSYKSAQSSSGTIFLVELPIANADLSKFRMGMNGDATIVLEEKADVLSIPIDATLEKDGQTVVNVKTGEFTYEERVIETGMETEDRIEVLSGVNVGDEVVMPE